MVLEPEKPFNLTVAAVGLSPGRGETAAPGSSQQRLDALGGASASLWLSCGPSTRIVGFAGSKEAWIFDEAGLRGGVGVHTFGGLDATGANVVNKFQGRLLSPQGLFFVNIQSELLTNHVGMGLLQITYPGGSDTMLDRPRNYLVEDAVGLLERRDLERLYRAGPGTYELTATYASADSMGMLGGGLLGLAPLKHPNDLLAVPLSSAS